MQSCSSKPGHVHCRSADGGSGSSNSTPQETVRTAELDNHGLVHMQRQVMQEQDTELAELEKTVNSTKVGLASLL